MDKPRIVVGIDGSSTAAQAMYWAAIECGRRAAELVLAHAGDTEAGRSPDSGLPTSYGRSLLAEAEAGVFESGLDCPISTVIAPENPVHLLTRLSEQADLLVVGSHGLGKQASLLLGSVAFRVAAHARCPVAVIPTGWDEQAHAGKPVVVGIPESISANTALYLAFAEARARGGVPVRAVRTWSRVDWTGDLMDLIYTTRPVFQAKQQEHTDRLLAPVRVLFPEVPVQTVLSGERIDDVMLTATADAALLVLGSRFADGHSYSRLGATTARLMHRVHCPALVVGRAEWQAAGEPDGRSRVTVPARQEATP